MTYPCSNCNRDEGSPICTSLCGRAQPTWPPRPPAPEEALRPAFEKAFMAYYTNGAHLLERFDTGHYRSQEAQAAWRIAREFRDRIASPAAPLQLETAEEARKDRAHAEAYYRQAERLLTANEATLHAEIERLRSDLPRAWGVSRDLASPGQRSVLVSFERALTDDELRALHDMLADKVVTG